MSETEAVGNMTTLNHEEATELAWLKREESNLARCYLDLKAENERLRALTVGTDVGAEMVDDAIDVWFGYEHWRQQRQNAGDLRKQMREALEAAFAVGANVGAEPSEAEEKPKDSGPLVGGYW